LQEIRTRLGVNVKAHHFTIVRASFNNSSAGNI
jgi:hypothetical protein